MQQKTKCLLMLRELEDDLNIIDDAIVLVKEYFLIKGNIKLHRHI